MTGSTPEDTKEKNHGRLHEPAKIKCTQNDREGGQK
jgi:hypothetical protein